MNCTHLGKTPASQLGVGGQGSGSTEALGTTELPQKTAPGTYGNGLCHCLGTWELLFVSWKIGSGKNAVVSHSLL